MTTAARHRRCPHSSGCQLAHIAFVRGQRSGPDQENVARADAWEGAVTQPDCADRGHSLPAPLLTPCRRLRPSKWRKNRRRSGVRASGCPSAGRAVLGHKAQDVQAGEMAVFVGSVATDGAFLFVFLVASLVHMQMCPVVIRLVPASCWICPR